MKKRPKGKLYTSAIDVEHEMAAGYLPPFSFGKRAGLLSGQTPNVPDMRVRIVRADTFWNKAAVYMANRYRRVMSAIIICHLNLPVRA